MKFGFWMTLSVALQVYLKSSVHDTSPGKELVSWRLLGLRVKPLKRRMKAKEQQNSKSASRFVFEKPRRLVPKNEFTQRWPPHAQHQRAVGYRPDMPYHWAEQHIMINYLFFFAPLHFFPFGFTYFINAPV